MAMLEFIICRSLTKNARQTVKYFPQINKTNLVKERKT
jgi:hypothetical protein